MVFKNVFNTQLYNETFARFLGDNENTNKDEIFVDMKEPMGDEVTYLYMKNAHAVTDCKAFVTTTDERILIAVFNIYGKFHKCYIMNLGSLKNIEIKKVFGGMRIEFDGISQYGEIQVSMYAANRQYGTDMTDQGEHLRLFTGRMKKIKDRIKDNR